MSSEVDLRVCQRGHVTDPYADVDTSTGYVIGPDNPTGAVHRRSVPAGLIERGSIQFTEACRAAVRLVSQQAAHRCGRPVRRMNDPELAAYRLGGPAAVLAMYREPP